LSKNSKTIPEIKTNSSGSEFIVIGKILAPWGNKGELKVEVITDFPKRFASSSTVYVNHQPLTVENCRWHKGNAIIKFKTVDSPGAAQKLKGQTVEIPRGQLEPLPEGQYYHFQIIGLEVWTTRGEQLGRVTEILASQSNDIYIVHGNRGEILIPAIADVIKSIDLNQGRLIIEPIEGLLNLNR